MEVTVRAITETKEILNRCRVTVWKDALEKQPTETFLDNIYKSEHSPIRDRMFVIEIRGIKSWVATHFVRHHIGCTPYVSTQRDDRIDYSGNRDDRRQGELVNMDLTLNAQAFINISRKRLCGMAHTEAQKVWNRVIKALREIDPQLAKNCVPECIYRGFCPEHQQCGRIDTPLYRKLRKEYIGDKPAIDTSLIEHEEDGIIMNAKYIKEGYERFEYTPISIAKFNTPDGNQYFVMCDLHHKDNGYLGKVLHPVDEFKSTTKKL